MAVAVVHEDLMIASLDADLFLPFQMIRINIFTPVRSKIPSTPRDVVGTFRCGG